MPDWEYQFEMLSDVAGHYKGAFPIPWGMKMTWKEFYPWYKRYEREVARDAVIRDCVNNDKPTPSPARMQRMIDKKLEEWKREVD